MRLPLLLVFLCACESSITVPGIANASKPVLFFGTNVTICYQLATNAANKEFMLFPGLATSGGYWPMDSQAKLPDASQACINVSLPALNTVPAGILTLCVVNMDTLECLDHLTFDMQDAYGLYTTVIVGKGTLAVSYMWNIISAYSSVYDRFLLLKSDGTVFTWYYTNCKCQTFSAATKPAPYGTYTYVFNTTAPAFKGGLTPQYIPGNGTLAGRVVGNPPAWAKYGL